MATPDWIGVIFLYSLVGLVTSVIFAINGIEKFVQDKGLSEHGTGVLLVLLGLTWPLPAVVFIPWALVGLLYNIIKLCVPAWRGIKDLFWFCMPKRKNTIPKATIAKSKVQ